MELRDLSDARQRGRLRGLGVSVYGLELVVEGLGFRVWQPDTPSLPSGAWKSARREIRQGMINMMIEWNKFDN